MELYVATALKCIGETFPFAVSESVAPQEYGGRTIEFAAPVTVEGNYVFDGTAFTIAATVTTSLHSACARCGETFDEPLTFDFSEQYVKNAEFSDEDESYSFAGDRLDLSLAVMDNVYLHLPMTSVCRSDCKGLCLMCGTNLNHSTCNCTTVAKRNPFSALEALCIDNKEV